MSFTSYFRTRSATPMNPNSVQYVITVHFGMWESDPLAVVNYRVLAWTIKHSMLKYEFDMFGKVKFGPRNNITKASYPFEYNADDGKWKMAISYLGL